MSNIPLARTKLESILLNPRMLVRERRALLAAALKLMHRRKAKFKAPKEIKAMTPAQRRRARKLRYRDRLSIHRIALILGTTHGRVSEAVSGKAH